MSISVDDSGIPEPGGHPVPLPELQTLPWLDIWHDHTTYPDLATQQEADEFAAVLDDLAASSGVPAPYLHAIRTGTLDTRYRITVGGRPVYIVLAHLPAATDPAREAASWAELRSTIATADRAGCDGIHPALPRELALAVWDHNGHEITACRPGTPTGVIRSARSRIRRRLTALSPLPLLGALTQPLAGGATAVGIMVAPIAPALPHQHTPPTPPGYTAPAITGGGDVARPALPWLSEWGSTTPTRPAPLLPPTETPTAHSAPDTAADFGPEPAPPPQTQQPSSPAPQPTLEVAPSESPAPTSIPTELPPTPVTDLLDDLLRPDSPAPTAEPTQTQPQPVRSLIRRITRHRQHRRH